MSWVLNKLEKLTDITYIPGTPEIPGTDGTAGSPEYTYWKETSVGGLSWANGPPTGWDNILYIPSPGGGGIEIKSGGYQYKNGQKGYLTGVLAGVEYFYTAPAQIVRTLVTVPAVPAIPGTPGTPGTAGQTISNYNLGWNAGALAPDDLAENQVFSWRMSAGNVGSVVGVARTIDPQDNGYVGMVLSVMTTSGTFMLYHGSVPFTTPAPFTDATQFALARTNEGTLELYKDGGLIHSEALADGVIVDTSLYSGGDVIWDAVETTRELAPLNSNIAATTQSDAQAVASAITVPVVVGPGTALGVAGATTRSAAINGSVVVDGVVNTSGAATTVSAAVSVDAQIGAVIVFGPGTALGVAGATTESTALAVGDVETGVGISTRVGAADLAFLPLAGAASGPNTNSGWTGNYQGDALFMEPMEVESAGNLAAPIIGIADCLMVPMNASVTGLTGEVSVSSNNVMLPMAALASGNDSLDPEFYYSQAYGTLHPLTAVATDEPLAEELFYREITDTILATVSEVQANYGSRVLDSVFMGATAQTFYHPTIELTDLAVAMATYENAFVLEIAELFKADLDSISATSVIAIAEALYVAGVVQTHYHGIVALLASVIVSDSNKHAVPATIQEEAYAASKDPALMLAAQFLDEVNIASSYENTLTIVVEETARFEADDTIELTAKLLAEILDEIDVYSLFKTPVDLAQGWVMNTEGDMPISEYDSFEFIAMAQFKGVLSGTSDDGLYVMGADTDDGQPITSEIASLMLDFGTSRQKRISSAYLGYTSESELVLKVRSVSDGVLFEHWYKACPVVADAPREGRVNVGKGLRSRYWQFELTNVDGGDFEIDQLEMYPIFLSRRV
jgi:hypothetical protein